MSENINKSKMKLSAEIKDGWFLYSWEIGTSNHSGKTRLCADTMIAFTSMIDLMSRAFASNFKKEYIFKKEE